MTRPSRIEVSASALRSNVEALVELCAPAAVCAVVKANAYGHGAVLASREALAGGASVLAVALVEEAVELREAGIDAPILVLSAPQRDDWATVAELGLESFVYSRDDIEAAAAAAGAGSVGGARGEVEVGLHLKVDTGMRRVGCEVGDALELAGLILDTPGCASPGSQPTSPPRMRSRRALVRRCATPNWPPFPRSTRRSRRWSRAAPGRRRTDRRTATAAMCVTWRTRRRH